MGRIHENKFVAKLQKVKGYERLKIDVDVFIIKIFISIVCPWNLFFDILSA